MGKNIHYKLPTIGAIYNYNIRNQVYPAKIHYIGTRKSDNTQLGGVAFCIVEFDYLLRFEFMEKWGCDLIFNQSAGVLMRDLICTGYNFNESMEIWTNEE
jgi:hypothetical protein